MGRIPVPEDYPAQAVLVCGTNDYHYGTSVADVDVSDRRHARPLQIRQDEDGRYVGCGGDIADAVRDHLGVGTCQVEKSDGDICGRDLPCPYHSDD